MRLKSLMTMIGVFWSCGLWAQGAPMTNNDVLKMIAAGLADDVVVASITQAPERKFDVSVDALIELKARHVSDRVLSTMAESMTRSAPPAGMRPTVVAAMRVKSSASSGATANDPSELREAGIYFDAGEGKAPRLVALSTPKATGKSYGGMWKNAALMGVTKTTANYRVKGAAAILRVPSTPVFSYMPLIRTTFHSSVCGRKAPNENSPV